MVLVFYPKIVRISQANVNCIYQFVDVHKLDAKSLANVIISVLTQNSRQNCVAQRYDGASVMSECRNRVQALVREKSKSLCLYFHCYAHKLNLALVDICNDIRVLSDVLGLMQAIHSFFAVSPLHHDVLKQKQSNV